MLSNTTQVSTPSGDLAGVSIHVADQTFQATYVCMGNPHVVIFVDDISRIPVESYGPEIEFNPLFPQRANIEFVQVLPDSTLRMRVWERGSGITQACGTGACATAVAAFTTGRSPRTSTVRMDGGELHIHLRESDNHVLMTGPAETSFEGELNV